MTFFKTFQVLCESVGSKPNPIAKEIGVSSATVTKWKRGVIPNGETLKKIADYFDVTTDYLLGNTDFPWRFNPDEANDYIDECCTALFGDLEYKGIFIDLQKLNKQGLDKAMQYISDLADMDKYKNDYTRQVDEAYRENLDKYNKKVPTTAVAYGGDNKEIELSEDNLRKAVSLIEDDD